MTDSGPSAPVTVLVIDMANVVGSVPDRWWRDRAGASERLLSALGPLSGRTVTGPGGASLRLARIFAVLEGRANRAKWPDSREREPTARDDRASGPSQKLEVIRAPGSGDDAICTLTADLVAAGDQVLVVSADRGLRARLPPETATSGPGWLNGLLGRT